METGLVGGLQTAIWGSVRFDTFGTPHGVLYPAPLQTQLPKKSLAGFWLARGSAQSFGSYFWVCALPTRKPTSLHLIGFYPVSCSPRTRASLPSL